MPEVKIDTSAGRAEGELSDMHPDLDGGLGLMPQDILKGAGNFLVIDAEKNPQGLKLGQPPRLVSRKLLMGTSPDGVTQQNTSPISVAETSYVMNGPLVDGEVPPDVLMVGAIAQPEAPTIQAISAEKAGLPASTPEKPYWITYSFMRGTGHSALAPAIKVPLVAEGQSLRLTLPDKAPVGTTHIGVWLSQPGTSTASTIGQMRLQATYQFSAYGGHEVEITGSFKYDTNRSGQTSLGVPGPPDFQHQSTRNPLRTGTYFFAITAANSGGESLPSRTSGPLIVTADPLYGIENPAGRGQIQLTRPTLPGGASGWYVYVLHDGTWYTLHHTISGFGSTKPFPSSWDNVTFGGWTGAEVYGKQDNFLLSVRDAPPVQDASDLEPPDSPLTTVSVFGASHPGPGRYYARVIDVAENGEESPMSPPASIDLAQDEVMRIVFANPLNRLPNGTLAEKGADGLPLGYTILNTGAAGGVNLENGELIIETNGPQSGDTPIIETDLVSVNPNQEWSTGATLRVDYPRTGAIQGSFEAVLRELDGSGGATETILKNANLVGEHRFYQVVSPSGFPGVAWQSDTVSAQLVYRFSGSTKNMVVYISRQELKDFAYSFRRREEGGANQPSNPNPAPETTANPGGSVAVEPSPTPETTPETITQTGPDRPLSDGVVEETQGFSSLTGWTQDASGATISLSSGKLVLQKTATGAARARVYKSFAPLQGLTARHAMGIAANGVSIPTLFTNGSVTWLEHRRSDGEKPLWLDLDSRHEQARLRIDGTPLESGNIVTTLDENGVVTQRSTSVVAVRERASLTINSAPNQNGDVRVTLGDIPTTIPVAVAQPAQQEIVKVEITRSAAGDGILGIGLGEPHIPGRRKVSTVVTASVKAGDSPPVIAAKLRAYASNPNWPSESWTISGTGPYVALTAKLAAATYGGHYFSSMRANSPQIGIGETYASATITVPQKGRSEIPADTPESIADKIRATTFQGHTAGGTPGSPTVDFEALEPGIKVDASYTPYATGASGSMVTTLQGAQDTPEQVATKVAATYSGNAYWTVSASGIIVTFDSVQSGAKQDATFSAGGTGTLAQMRTPIQGSTDIVAYARDRLGILRQRRILTGITTSSNFDVDLSVSGAGYPFTDQSRAVVAVWAAETTGSTKTLRALFENVDLGDYNTGIASAGISSESSNSLLWEMRIEELKVTDRGEKWYRYHDYQGQLLNQLYGSFLPNQPPRDDLYIQELRRAVLPNTTYTGSVFYRHNGIPLDAPAKPFSLYLITPDNEVTELGDLTTGFGGLMGTTSWRESAPFEFTTGPNDHEIRLESRHVGAGEIVAQELCISPGTTVKRTPLYALSGTYTATLEIETPEKPYLQSEIGRTRKSLGIDIETPDGSAAITTYSASDAREGPYGLPVSDPASLEQKNYIRVDVSASGNGIVTPLLKSGFPYAEYVIRAAEGPEPTFLKEDRTEFEGGAFFGELEEHSEPPEVVYQILPGFRPQRTATYPPVGYLPPFTLLVFTPETRRYIEDRSGMVDFCIEARGKILKIRTSGPVTFKRQIRNIPRSNGSYFNYYIASVPACWVLEEKDLP